MSMLGGCAQRAERGVWVPMGGVEAATIGRDARFAVAPDSGSQTLIYERKVRERGRLDAVEQWVLELPVDVSVGDVIEVSDGAARRALVFERVDLGSPMDRGRVVMQGGRADLFYEQDSFRTFAAPLEGVVEIASSDGETLVAIVNVRAPSQLADAGASFVAVPRLSGEFAFTRSRVSVYAAEEPLDRAGVPALQRKPDPIDEALLDR